MGRFWISCRIALFLLMLMLGASACEQDGTGERVVQQKISPTPSTEVKKAGEAEEKIKIGFSMDTLLEERWLKDRDLFKKEVEALGAEIEIMAASGDDALQISQAETLIDEGVDLLVVVPHNAEAIAAIVHKAHKAGIKVIAYDRLIKNADVDLYVSFDNEKVGELQAKAMTRLVPEGNYVYIGGADTDNNAHLLKKGVFNVLQPFIDSGKITVAYDQWTKDWSPASAEENMMDALEANGGRIDAVIAANDATAAGVIKALEAKGLAGEIPVAGQDAELAGVRSIVEGTQTMTVYKPIKLLTKESAELVVRLAKGGSVETEQKINNGKVEVPAVLLPPVAVDKANIEDTIIADGFHSKKDVYGSEER
ncbi:D-xylose ABC transporter substrate-binding protein [Planomicrobium sp. CPCC 101110]|uniref:D-xylose ABC transporter substrate-binding protein n=1 Tax=Planomicrobium sp. CPCC 101110 TaxID=2599619 RepID=UPI0011B6E1CF|nr:D-xylose ABC transporter substrate-binding protein [Planomicrobium sp. CPCC 101110]TWT25165.1 D-xylose ABC transporter substrate-binding protein [Planomicrobium sp. CPCC 101110]